MSRIVNKRTHEQFVDEMRQKFPTIEILSFYETRDSKIKFRCSVCNNSGTRAAKRLLVWSGCPVCNHKKGCSSWTQDEFVSMVHGLAGEEFEVLGVYKNNLTPVEMRHSACNGRFSKCLSSGLSKRMCPYCSNREVLIGYNDLWTTNPRKAMMLKDDVLGCVMTGSEEDYVDVICPNCNRTLVKRMNKFSETYCPCPYCSSTYPFPERFMMSVLTQLGIEFVHDSKTSWSGDKRYDFIIGDNIICETHGQQHYEDRPQFHKHADTSEVKKNDEYKRQLAASNGVTHYIEINCSRSDAEFIKNSILNSELSKLFDFSDFDWQKCEEVCFSHSDMEYVELYRQGYSAPKIAEIMGVNHSKAWQVLKRAAANGLCDYDPVAARTATQFKFKNSD